MVACFRARDLNSLVIKECGLVLSVAEFRTVDSCCVIGSPERDHIPNPKHSREDVRKVSEPVHARRESRRESDDRSSRYGRGGVDSHRHDRRSRDDDQYRSKRDEYYRHERDAPRSSRNHRKAETEHSRLRNDSDRRSRDRAVSGRRHADSRAEEKEKDYVKRGSRWTFGESRDEKELEDREINKEKDVHHAKSPRDRPDGATENRDTHSKKLKGFVSEKFTHGNTNGTTFLVSLVSKVLLAPCSKL